MMPVHVVSGMTSKRKKRTLYENSDDEIDDSASDTPDKGNGSIRKEKSRDWILS